MTTFNANLKEVNDLIDLDQEFMREKKEQPIICEVCNHPIHTRCNGADCEDGECWKDGEDFEDEE